MALVAMVRATQSYRKESGVLFRTYARLLIRRELYRESTRLFGAGGSREITTADFSSFASGELNA